MKISSVECPLLNPRLRQEVWTAERPLNDTQMVLDASGITREGIIIV